MERDQTTCFWWTWEMVKLGCGQLGPALGHPRPWPPLHQLWQARMGPWPIWAVTVMGLAIAYLDVAFLGQDGGHGQKPVGTVGCCQGAFPLLCWLTEVIGFRLSSFQNESQQRQRENHQRTTCLHRSLWLGPVSSLWPRPC